MYNDIASRVSREVLDAEGLPHVAGYSYLTLVQSVVSFEPANGEPEEETETLLNITLQTNVFGSFIRTDRSKLCAEALCEARVIKWLARLMERFLNHSILGPFVPGTFRRKSQQSHPSYQHSPWEKQAIALFTLVIISAHLHVSREIAVQIVEAGILFSIEKLLDEDLAGSSNALCNVYFYARLVRITDYIDCVLAVLLQNSILSYFELLVNLPGDDQIIADGFKQLRTIVSRARMHARLAEFWEVQIYIAVCSLSESKDATLLEPDEFCACIGCSSRGPMQQCVKCRAVFYCNRTCQRTYVDQLQLSRTFCFI